MYLKPCDGWHLIYKAIIKKNGPKEKACFFSKTKGASIHEKSHFT